MYPLFDPIQYIHIYLNCHNIPDQWNLASIWNARYTWKNNRGITADTVCIAECWIYRLNKREAKHFNLYKWNPLSLCVLSHNFCISLNSTSCKNVLNQEYAKMIGGNMFLDKNIDLAYIRRCFMQNGRWFENNIAFPYIKVIQLI